MKLLTVVYSRMSSSRFPKKALSLVPDKPLFERVVNSLSNLRELGDVIVGTSNDISDDELADYCSKMQITNFRGDLFDVSLRTRQILAEYKPTFFCRVCGDRPLLTPDFVECSKSIFLDKHEQYDLVTNMNSNFDPAGLKIEFIRASTFVECSYRFNHLEREHITKYFYDKVNLKKAKIFNFSFNHEDHSNVNLCIDTVDDLKRVNFLLEKIQGNSLEYNHKNVFHVLSND